MSLPIKKTQPGTLSPKRGQPTLDYVKELENLLNSEDTVVTKEGEVVKVPLSAEAKRRILSTLLDHTSAKPKPVETGKKKDQVFHIQIQSFSSPTAGNPVTINSQPGITLSESRKEPGASVSGIVVREKTS